MNVFVVKEDKIFDLGKKKSSNTGCVLSDHRIFTQGGYFLEFEIESSL